MARIIRPDVATMAQNIRNVYALAERHDIFEGLSWYAAALVESDSIARDYDIPLYKAAGVIAALSPQMPWSRNVTVARACVIAWRAGLPLAGHTGAQLSKVRAILDSADASIEAIAILVQGKTGYKTVRFFLNIVGRHEVACVDRHALGIAYNTVFGDSVPSLTEKQYLDVELAYQTVARELGITTSALQAITWLVWRRIHGIEDSYGR